jgi:hypothetical protein
VVIVSEEPEEPAPGGVQVRSDHYRLRLGALVEGTLGRDAHGNAVGLPRAVVVAEGLLSTVLEVGFHAEVDLSPWSSRRLKEDGPGFLRDTYVRMALGNKRLLDLGEARVGLLSPLVMAEQRRGAAAAWWLTGTLGREAWLPGRELAAAYELSAYRHGFPVRGLLALGSGVGQGVLPALSVQEEGQTGPAGVPLTAGDPGTVRQDASLSVRVEGEPFWRWAGLGRLKMGVGGLAKPLAQGDDARAAVAVDVELVTPTLKVRASGLVADRRVAPLLESKALAVEGALEILPDFADVRGRYDVAMGATGIEGQRVSVGAAFFYLDGPAWLPLTESPEPGRAGQRAPVFTLAWLRTYDLQRLSGVTGVTGGGGAWGAGAWGAGAGTPLGGVVWLLGGDADQLVLRVAL